jgi:hypothetical protein
MKHPIRVLLIASLIVAATYSRCLAASGDTGEPGCSKTTFALKIADVGPTESPRPTVMVDIGKWGLRRVLLDTGTSFNTVLLDDRGGASQDQAFNLLGRFRSRAFGADLTFYSLAVPAAVIARARERQLDGFLLNPRLIDPANFVVLDFKKGWLLGFSTETDLRACYGRGARSTFLAGAENDGNTFSIDATLDEAVSGRVALDTGAYLTEFWSPQVSTKGASRSAAKPFFGADGSRRVRYVAAGHIINVGDVTLTPNLVSVPVEPDAPRSNDLVATIGYSELNGAVIIVAPRAQNFWELLF